MSLVNNFNSIADQIKKRNCSEPKLPDYLGKCVHKFRFHLAENQHIYKPLFFFSEIR